MSQISENRRKRKIRRIIGFSLTGVLLLTVIIFWLMREDPPPVVRTGSLYEGDISSVMMVSAQIQPGSVQEIAPTQYQRVINVNVEVGDQVNAGDILLTLDQNELREQYEQAQETRKQIESSIAQSAEAAKAQEAALQAQAQEVQKAQAELNRQTSELAASLSETTAELVKLTSIQPSAVELDPEISAQILTDLADFDPEAPDAQVQLQAAVALLQENIVTTENPEYNQQMAQLETELQKFSGITTSLINALNSANDINSGLNTDLTGQLSDQLTEQLADQIGGISGIGNSLESALAQAVAYEEAAESSLAASVSELRATSSGLVALVNVKPGDYTGNTSLAPVDSSGLATGGMDLSALLDNGSSLSGLGSAVSQKPAIVIYDNNNPKAVFQASQFDSKRIEEGMKVEFDYDGQLFSGSISYIAPYATGSQFSSSTNSIGGSSSAIPSELSGLSGLGELTGEPTLLVEMEIDGNNLEQLVPGFKIDASIQTDAAENVLILPAEAMRREIDKWYVFVVDQNNKLIRKDFTAGIQAEMTVQVIDGLSIDDRVVLNPSNQLIDGMLVEINNEQADS